MEENNIDQSDKDWIDNYIYDNKENYPELKGVELEKPKGKDKPMSELSLQDTMPESVASVTYKLITPKGFPILFTMRGNSDENLIARMEAQETEFVMKGYQPDIYKGKGGKIDKPIEYVPNRSCPKCGAQLVYFESKGVKHIKCSTAKYDWQTKTSSGCAFVEWNDAKPAGTITEQSVGGVMLATQAQQALIQQKFPELWFEGMTKVQASQVIQANFNK